MAALVIFYGCEDLWLAEVAQGIAISLGLALSQWKSTAVVKEAASVPSIHPISTIRLVR